MQTYPLIKRLSLIVELLSAKYPPTLKEMEEKLNDAGFEIDKRTIQRDMKRLKEDFGLEYSYKVSNKTYSVDTKDIDFESFLRLSRMVSTSDLLMQSLRDRDRTLTQVSFQTSVRSDAGTRWLETAYRAIREGRCLSIMHHNYQKRQTTTRVVRPLMLKEYQDNWYLVATAHDSMNIRFFGLDRIETLTVTDESFDPKACPPVADMFDNVIGLQYELEPEKIEIVVDAERAQYFRATPLHHSQIEISATSDKVVFGYYLVPNMELRRLLLGFGAQLRVLAPEWFAHQMVEEIDKMRALYI